MQGNGVSEVNSSSLLKEEAFSFHLYLIASPYLAVSSCCLPFTPWTPLSHINPLNCKKGLDFCWFNQLIWLNWCVWGVPEAAQGMRAGLRLGRWVGWEKVLGKNGLNEGNSPNWQYQGFNFGSIAYRPVRTTPCSPGIQQLIGTSHGPRLQEVLLGGCEVTASPRTVCSFSPICSLGVLTPSLAEVRRDISCEITIYAS